ncbi:MAG: hypothetical protein K2M07_02740 [Muribaculaceae bacterium]|nr:hypothetical protein [Muribaculaceae bacterium]
MRIAKLFLTAVILLGLTSCLGDSDNEQIEKERIYQIFNVVEDTQKGTTEIVTGVAYQMEVNFTNMTMNLSISGLQVSQSAPAYNLEIQNVNFQINKQGEIVVNVPSVSNGAVTVSDFKFKKRMRSMGMEGIPVYDITYIVNGSYNVRSVQMSTFYFGQTETTIIGTESLFKTDETFYCVTFDPTVRKDGKPQARLFMYNAKFAPKMPEMNLMLLELYADFTVDGFTIKADEASVYTGTVQNPKEEPDYAVTDFDMIGKFSTGVEFEYTAAGRFHSSAKCGYDFTDGVLN